MPAILTNSLRRNLTKYLVDDIAGRNTTEITKTITAAAQSSSTTVTLRDVEGVFAGDFYRKYDNTDIGSVADMREITAINAASKTLTLDGQIGAAVTVGDTAIIASRKNAYYLFVGGTLPWKDSDGDNIDATPPVPGDNPHDADLYSWQHMIAMKKITESNISHVVPIHRWISGTTYKEYDDRDADLVDSNYYVLTEANNIYICLKSKGASTVSPAGNDTGIDDNSGSGGDGYVWKYLYTISQERANRFLTTGFMPVQHLTAKPDGTDHQWNVQENAVDGAVYNIKVVSGGTGYSSNPTVTVDGDGSGLTIGAVTVDSGSITNIAVDYSANTNTGFGQDYTRCRIKITDPGGSGTGASARAVIGPPGGFGHNALNDLRAHHCIVNMELTQAEGGGDFIVGNDFRQIGIIRNPYNWNSTEIASVSTRSALGELTIDTSGSPSFTADDLIEGTVSGALARVVTYAGGKIKYVQNNDTGFKSFDDTTPDQIRLESENSGGHNLTAVSNPEVQPFSGEVIYVENRSPVTRTASQTETIKIVAEL